MLEGPCVCLDLGECCTSLVEARGPAQSMSHHTAATEPQCGRMGFEEVSLPLAQVPASTGLMLQHASHKLLPGIKKHESPLSFQQNPGGHTQPGALHMHRHLAGPF